MVREKIKSIIFSALLVPYTVGMAGMFTSYFAFFHRPQFQVTVTSLAKDRLELLVLTKEEFARTSWTDGRKEFEHNGKMFDVSRIEQNGNLYLVYCENDSLEDLFVNYLKTSGSKGKSGLIAHVQFIVPLPEFSYHNFSIRQVKPNCSSDNLYVSVPDELNTPPPKKS